MTRYPVDADGKLIVIIHDGDLPPEAVGEADRPPQRQSDIWNGTDWIQDLPEAKARARKEVSDAAEAARLQFITPGSGKAMAYTEKAKQAEAFLADPLAGQEGHAETLYPSIYAEVGSTADDAAGVAQVVDGLYRAFKLIEAQIGGREAWAQKAVKEAATAADIDAILAVLVWPAPGEA